MNSAPRLARPSVCLAAVLALTGALQCPATRAGATCTALADAVTGRLLKSEGLCDQRVTPASTFKIALSLMGYDSGFLTHEHLPALPFHDGYVDYMPSWKATTDPTTWIKNSVVWYSQQLTEWLGEERFRHYVEAFHYGNADVSGDPVRHDGLTHAWLSSSLRISPLEQLEFLHRLITRQLPVSARAYDMTSRITAVGKANGWELHGKSGNGARVNADGTVDHTRQIGWFVGWASQGERVVAFARCIQDDGPQPEPVARRAREGMLRDLPGLLDSL
jgi:beta-lactamase class D